MCIQSIRPSRVQWEEIEEFPPYELAVDAGKEMWETPFANGKTYADCFENGGAVRGQYPYWDADRKEGHDHGTGHQRMPRSQR